MIGVGRTSKDTTDSFIFSFSNYKNKIDRSVNPFSAIISDSRYGLIFGNGPYINNYKYDLCMHIDMDISYPSSYPESPTSTYQGIILILMIEVFQ